VTVERTRTADPARSASTLRDAIQAAEKRDNSPRHPSAAPARPAVAGNRALATPRWQCPAPTGHVDRTAIHRWGDGQAGPLRPGVARQGAYYSYLS
jgi:hypothetical protein